MSETTVTGEEYLVVVNHEQQYSIWRADREVPAGWEATGFGSGKDACLAHIAEVWTDMRPMSVRLRDEERAAAEAVR